MAKATFDRVRDFVPPALRFSYVQSDIVADVDGRSRPVAELAERTGAPVFVVTAENPRMQPQGPADNQQLTDMAHGVLAEAGHDWWPAVRSDPRSDWQEASFAIVGMTRADIAALCRRFEQYAYFEITATQQIVRGVSSQWMLARPHGVDPLPVNPHRLSDAVAETTGLAIRDSLRRFRHRGWERVSPSEEPCDACSSLVDLYAVVHRQRSGRMAEHLAVCCPTCGRANAATQLGRGRLRALELWYDHQVALNDTGTRREQTNRRCYVIDLNMPTGPAVYVGETGKTVEERFQEHKRGYLSSPDARAHGIGLNRQLMHGLPEFPDQMTSRTYEAYLGKRLALAGHTVRGAH